MSGWNVENINNRGWNVDEEECQKSVTDTVALIVIWVDQAPINEVKALLIFLVYFLKYVYFLRFLRLKQDYTVSQKTSHLYNLQ